MLTWKTVFVIAALTLYIVSWLLSLLVLRRVGTRAAVLWQACWLVYLIAYAAVVIKPFELPVANYLLALGSSSVSLGLLFLALQDELGAKSLYWRLTLLVMLAFWGVMAFAIAGAYDFFRLHYAVYSLVEMYLVYMAYQVSRRWQSNSMLFVAFGAMMFVLSNGVRVLYPQHFALMQDSVEVNAFMGFYLVLLFSAPVLMLNGFLSHNLERLVSDRKLMRLQREHDQVQASAAQRHAEQLEAVVTERDQMLMTASRFNTVSNLGVLNSAIVHEMTQPLQTMVMNSQMLMQLLGDKEPLIQQMGESLLAATDKLGTTVRNLRALIVDKSLTKEAVTLQTVLGNAVSIVTPSAKRARVQMNVPQVESDMQVWAQATMLERVLINALVNALQSLEQASSVVQRQVEVTLEQSIDEQAVPWVHVSVQDNGPGFESAILQGLGQAFSTTKLEGMGLGLLLAEAALRQWDGRFVISNAPEGGARVCLSLRQVSDPQN